MFKSQDLKEVFRGRKEESREMDLGSVKRNLEKKEGTESASLINSMPSQVFDPFILHGLHIDLVERGRLICSMKVPPRLLVLFHLKFVSALPSAYNLQVGLIN